MKENIKPSVKFKLSIPFTDREIGKGNPKVVSVFGIEASIVDEIDATSDDVSGGESGTVRLTSAGGAEGVTIIAMVTVRVFVPSGQTVHVDALRRKSDSHISEA